MVDAALVASVEEGGDGQHGNAVIRICDQVL